MNVHCDEGKKRGKYDAGQHSREEYFRFHELVFNMHDNSEKCRRDKVQKINKLGGQLRKRGEILKIDYKKTPSADAKPGEDAAQRTCYKRNYAHNITDLIPPKRRMSANTRRRNFTLTFLISLPPINPPTAPPKR